MLRLGLMAFALLVGTQPAGASDPLSFEVIKEVDLSKEQIFDRALLWLASTGRSSKDVVEYKDKTLGTIVGNSTTEIVLQGPVVSMKIPVKFGLKIDTKEKRYRMTFGQVRVTIGGNERAIEDANRNALEPLVITKFNDLAISLQSQLSKADRDEAW